MLKRADTISAPTERTENIAKSSTFTSVKADGAEPHPYGANKEYIKKAIHSQALNRADNIRLYGANKKIQQKSCTLTSVNAGGAEPHPIYLLAFKANYYGAFVSLSGKTSCTRSKIKPTTNHTGA